MHKLVVQILNIVDLACRSHISIFVPVSLDDSIDAGQHHEVPDVELAVVVEERLVDVGLDDVGRRLTVLLLHLSDQPAQVAES